MQQDTSRNTILFIVFALVILTAYQFFVIGPQTKARQAELKSQTAVAGQTQAPAGAPVPTAAPQPLTRAAAKAATPRVMVDTPALAGSLTLKGARIDDLYLKQYREGLPKSSPPVELFRPEGAQNAWFAEFGWTGQNLPGLPTRDTVWTVKQGDVLAPGKPVVLTYATPQGLVFTRTVSVDERYMFTIADTVANLGAAAVTLAPYGSVQRQGLPETHGRGSQIVHEGALGVFNDELSLKKYRAWKKEHEETHTSTGGWLGITDKYWLAALIPDQQEKIAAAFRVTPVRGVDVYETSYVGRPHQIAPGRQISETTHLFAGAKVVPMLKDYQAQLGLPRFDSAVDWGMFWFFTRPIFWVLEQFYHLIGNFGVAILLLTVAVKFLFFPLANKSYESITKMKKIQPRVEELKAKYKDDPARQQQEMMQIYQKEKINPLMGCLPILIQIPVFYSLYKVLSVTIEMRHAPFFGWIQDLSSRDPTTLWNLFGLIPWNPAHAPMIGGLLDGSLHIGVWPLIMGFTMWLQQGMNPPAPDPMQQRIFQIFPIVFTFMLAPFAAGLVIYWSWNNLLSIMQQYVIMRRFKVDNPIDSLLARFGEGPVSEPFTEDEIEAARVLFARPVSFLMGAVSIEGLPPADMPEAAFAGRSNVGKSSLINALVGQKHLARASNEPGRTREVNFFVLDGRIRLVDLPGYGWAQASRTTVRKFQNLGRDYLRGRPNLKRVYLLIDARHGLKAVDTEALDTLDLAAISYQIVLTKADKLKPAEVEAVTERTLKAISKRPAAFPRVLATSAEKGTGIPMLRAEIASACAA